MEALVEVMEAEKLVPLFNIPAEMRNHRVEVTVHPIEPNPEEIEISGAAFAERIKKFRAKYTHERFIKDLKQKAAEGFQFDFDVQKVIDGTEWKNGRGQTMPLNDPIEGRCEESPSYSIPTHCLLKKHWRRIMAEDIVSAGNAVYNSIRSALITARESIYRRKPCDGGSM